jgi:hypothetical protein
MQAEDPSEVARMDPHQLDDQLEECTSPEQVLELAGEYGKSFDYIHASLALHSLTKLWLRWQGSDLTKEEIAPVVDLAREHLPRMKTQALTDTLWSVSKLGPAMVEDVEGLVRALLDVARPQLYSFIARDASNTLVALAALGGMEAFDGAVSGFVRALLKEVEPQLFSFSDGELSNTLWALAKLKYAPASETDGPDGGFVSAWVKEARFRLPNFTDQELTDTLWALAKLEYAPAAGVSGPDGRFVSSLLREDRSRLSRFTNDELAVTLWAVAKLGYTPAAAAGGPDGGFVSALLREAHSRLSSLTNEHLAMILWALGRLGCTDASAAGVDGDGVVLMGLATEANCRWGRFTPEERFMSHKAMTDLGYFT